MKRSAFPGPTHGEGGLLACPVGEIASVGVELMDPPDCRMPTMFAVSGLANAQSSVTLDIAMVRRLGAGLLGGEGFILQKLTGPGLVFCHAGGDHVDFTLGPGEVLQVQTGHLVAFEPSINYDVQLVGNIRTAIFGGEGLFLTTLTGPGRVILQSMTLERLRHELAPSEHAHNGRERNPLSAVTSGDFSSFFRSDD